jgi:hypothetical protein
MLQTLRKLVSAETDLVRPMAGADQSPVVANLFDRPSSRIHP